MATIQDVAKRAGVAPITVSRVVNRSGYVTQEVCERVEVAIAELGYVPNTLARSLRSRRTHTLALVLTDVTNPFFTTIARGVEDAASAAGYMVILCNTDEHEAKEQKYLQLLLQQQVDGILLVPARDSADALRLIQKQGTAVVVVDRRVEAGQADSVHCDSEAGAYRLVQLLTSLGHRDIAMLTGPSGVSTSRDRVEGYRRAMEEAGLGADRHRILYGEYTQDSGHALTLQALAAPPYPTALFAANNFIAIGALKALRAAGKRVPEEVALVSFDDLPAALITFPFLTVVAQPAYEMGQKAVELLLARLNGPPSAPFQEVVLPLELIVRQSSGGRRADSAL